MQMKGIFFESDEIFIETCFISTTVRLGQREAPPTTCMGRVKAEDRHEVAFQIHQA